MSKLPPTIDRQFSPGLHGLPPAGRSVGRQADLTAQYDLLGSLGTGRLTHAYRARDRVLDRIVVLKLLHQEYGAQPGFVARWYAEARAATALGHPAIAAIYDHGPHAGTAFLTMEYIEGNTLAEVLRRQGPPSRTGALALVDQVLDALAPAHARGLVHGGLTPRNLLLRAGDGVVVLTDFGQMTAFASTFARGPATGWEAASYLAPEQAGGGLPRPAVDVYAVGVLLHELLTGHVPDHRAAWRSSHARVAAGVPPALVPIVQRALAQDPARRYQHAEELRAALAAVADAGRPGRSAGWRAGGLAPAAPVRDRVAGGGTQRSGRRADRRRALLPLLLGVILLGLLPAVTGPTPPDPVPPTVVVAAQPATATPVGTPSDPTPPPAPAATPTEIATAAPAVTPAPSATPSTAATPTELATVAPTITPRPTAVESSPTISAPAPTTNPAPPVRAPAAMPSEVAAVMATAAAASPTAAPAPVVETSPTEGPTATPDAPPTATPAPTGRLSVNAFGPYQLAGAYRRTDGRLFGRPAVALYGAGSGYNQGELTFTVEALPGETLTLLLTGLDDERPAQCTLAVLVNGAVILAGPTDFPNVPARDVGVGGADRYWGQMQLLIPAGLLRLGPNTLTLRNMTPGSTLGVPYILINAIEFPTGD